MILLGFTHEPQVIYRISAGTSDEKRFLQMLHGEFLQFALIISCSPLKIVADFSLFTSRRTRSHYLSSSAFLRCSIVPVVKCLSLADLHLVHTITVWHLITTPPLPALPLAGILASSQRRQGGASVPSSNVKADSAP